MSRHLSPTLIQNLTTPPHGADLVEAWTDHNTEFKPHLGEVECFAVWVRPGTKTSPARFYSLRGKRSPSMIDAALATKSEGFAPLARW